jgi:hypothetical protein
MTALDEPVNSPVISPNVRALRGQASAQEKACEVRDIGLVFLPVFPQWDSLRSDKRFQDLVRLCGFPV